jgi:hypothetical protein
MKTIEQAAQEHAQKSVTQSVHVAFAAGAAFAQHWIPVEEELPQHKTKVLVLLNNDDVQTDYWFGFWLTFQNKVTHWRPIELK